MIALERHKFNIKELLLLNISVLDYQSTQEYDDPSVKQKNHSTWDRRRERN